MNWLDTDRLTAIEQRIEQSGIEDESLKIDLLDHICCLVEEKLEMGNTLDAAYQEVLATFKPSHLTAIKEETEFLTKSNIVMKKRTIIIGVVAVVLIFSGGLLKVNHVPGANLTLLIGFSTLAFGFVLFNLFDRFRYINEGSGKWWHLTGHTGLIATISGSAMKTLHLPGADVVILIGVIMLAVAFLIISSSKRLLKQ